MILKKMVFDELSLLAMVSTRFSQRPQQRRNETSTPLSSRSHFLSLRIGTSLPQEACFQCRSPCLEPTPSSDVKRRRSKMTSQASRQVSRWHSPALRQSQTSKLFQSLYERQHPKLFSSSLQVVRSSSLVILCKTVWSFPRNSLFKELRKGQRAQGSAKPGAGRARCCEGRAKPPRKGQLAQGRANIEQEGPNPQQVRRKGRPLRRKGQTPSRKGQQ